jgi:diaminopimelate decarboxylase
LAIDLDVVDAAIAEFWRRVTRADLEVSYAAKAFATVEFARHLARHPIGLDVCSLGELVTAERAGFPARRLTFHGAGKTEDELRAVCSGRVACIVVDGLEELERLTVLAPADSPPHVLLRMNVGVAAQTHAFVRTGGSDTKFGIPSAEEAAAIALLTARSTLRFTGLHAHLGSQIHEVAPFLESAQALLRAAQRFEAAGLHAKRLVIGGGFSVAATPEDAAGAIDPGDAVAQILDFVRGRSSALGLDPPRLGVEPGRAIVALAGTTIYRVMAVKRQSSRTFVVVDGGIAENPRPALYGARHHVVSVAASSAGDTEVTLCGRSCENDELGTVRLPRDLCPGDLLAMCATGAYTYSMAGNYNRFPRPAVVGIAGGNERLLARREGLEDLLRRDSVADASGQAGGAF